METATQGRKPSHRAHVVESYKDKDGNEKSRWLEIGSVWPHGDGKGFDVVLRAVPVDGRIVCRVDEPKPEVKAAPAV